MTDPRDSWYKPNLLYNIHYKPPTQLTQTTQPTQPTQTTSPTQPTQPTPPTPLIPPTPPTPAIPHTLPKMIVLTREFNPSVCTCGEHGCVPHYRMEREVVWSNKTARNETERKLKDDIQTKTNVKAPIESTVEVDDGRRADGEERKIRNDTTSRVNDKDGVSNTLPRADDLTQHDKPVTDVVDTSSTPARLEEAGNEGFGAAFGIMSVYCDSELHTWNWKNEVTE